MHIKKIIAKNFMIPGVQTFEFDKEHVLTNGSFYHPNCLKEINNLFNGDWVNHTISFEKFYPKWAKKTTDMNLQLDALIELTDEDNKKFNILLEKEGVKFEQKSKLWYYSIKAVYPYIFPVVTLVPAEKELEDFNFGFGNHYAKFVKNNLPKKELITVAAINAVGLLRDKYFEYKKKPIKENELVKYRQYLDIIKSTFRYDEQFIKKIAHIAYVINDGDIINYGDQAEFFFRDKNFINFIDSIKLLKEDLYLKEDFKELLYDVFFKDLQWIYSVKSSNQIYEIKKIIVDNYCEKSIYSKTLIDFFKSELKINLNKVEINELTLKYENNLDEALVYKDENKFDNFLEKETKEPIVKKEKTKKTVNDKMKLKKEQEKIKKELKAAKLKEKAKIKEAKNEQKRKEQEAKKQLNELKRK